MSSQDFTRLGDFRHAGHTVTPHAVVNAAISPRFFVDHAPSRASFFEDVLEGLSNHPRSIPPKYFFDEQGARLFRRICEASEYYLARAEREAITRFGGKIVAAAGKSMMLVQYGAHHQGIAELVLEYLPAAAGFISIDPSRRLAVRAARDVYDGHPGFLVAAVCGDVGGDFSLPAETAGQPRLGLMLGAVVGMFDPEGTRSVLAAVHRQLGRGSFLLAGIDLLKDPVVLRAAYNDGSGATAAFNLNLLGRMKRDLGAVVEIPDFVHRADFEPVRNRVEMRLAARRETAIGIAGSVFTFASGEAIHTGSHYKYTQESFSALANSAGFLVEAAWQDPEGKVGLQLLRAV